VFFGKSKNITAILIAKSSTAMDRKARGWHLISRSQPRELHDVAIRRSFPRHVIVAQGLAETAVAVAKLFSKTGDSFAL
jgi:hypothetical protein